MNISVTVYPVTLAMGMYQKDDDDVTMYQEHVAHMIMCVLNMMCDQN